MADDFLRTLLGSEAAGRVLDVATGRGDFLTRVLENLKPTIWPGFSIGLDPSHSVLKAFKAARTKAQAVQASAEGLPSPPATLTWSRSPIPCTIYPIRQRRCGKCCACWRPVDAC